MKITADKVSMWSGLFTIPPALAWYISAGQDVVSALRAAPGSVWPTLFGGLAIAFFVAMCLANAIIHSDSKARSANRSRSEPDGLANEFLEDVNRRLNIAHAGLVSLKPAIQGQNQKEVIAAINDLLAKLRPANPPKSRADVKGG